MSSSLQSDTADLEIDLAAAVVAVQAQTRFMVAPVVPHILIAEDIQTKEISLPSGPFVPLKHCTFELALRQFVTLQTGLDIGYAEQLYTFGDRGRHALPTDHGPHVVSVGYLALTRRDGQKGQMRDEAKFKPWYTPRE